MSKILELLERYKLRIPPTVYYDLLADVREMEEQAPTTKNDSSIYCDRNMCLKNEYNNVGCEDCEVTKSQESTTKNDLRVDCISRDEVCRYVAEFVNHEFSTREEEELIDNIITGIERMPSVTPQEPILDKIREQIKSHLRGVEITLEVLVENDPLRPKMEGAKDALEECLELINKAESEEE